MTTAQNTVTMSAAPPTPLEPVAADLARLRQEVAAFLAALGPAIDRTDYDQDARSRALGAAAHHFSTAFGFAENACWQRTRS